MERARISSDSLSALSFIWIANSLSSSIPEVTSWVTVRESKGGLGGLQGVPSISIHDLDALSPFEPGKAVIKEMKKKCKIDTSVHDGRR